MGVYQLTGDLSSTTLVHAATRASLFFDKFTDMFQVVSNCWVSCWVTIKVYQRYMIWGLRLVYLSIVYRCIGFSSSVKGSDSSIFGRWGTRGIFMMTSITGTWYVEHILGKTQDGTLSIFCSFYRKINKCDCFNLREINL